MQPLQRYPTVISSLGSYTENTPDDQTMVRHQGLLVSLLEARLQGLIFIRAADETSQKIMYERQAPGQPDEGARGRAHESGLVVGGLGSHDRVNVSKGCAVRVVLGTQTNDVGLKIQLDG